MESTLLLVEDDEDLRDLIPMAGKNKGYAVETAENGLAARKLLESGNEYGLIILDINMPGMDGFSFCRWLRDFDPRIPVMFLSARAEEYDKILALEIGGDDYLTKPFSMKELFTRVGVCLRRVRLYSKEKPDSQSPLERTGIVLNPETWTCFFNGRPLTLTISEFRILQKLLINPGIVLSRDALAQAAFPEDHFNTGRSIDIHISRLRKKLLAIVPSFQSIITVYQVGYKWQD